MLGFFRKKENASGLQLANLIGLQDSVMKIASKEVTFCTENDRIIDALATMLGGIRRLPVVNDAGEITGIVSSSDVLDFIGGGEKSKLFTNTGLSAVVKKIMSPNVQCLSSTDSIPVALEIFRMNGKPMHPVAENRKLSAVLSESDITHLVSKRCGVPVSAIMTRKPVYAQEDHSVFDVAKMLCRGPYRRLPVVNNGVVTGIVTPHDILAHLNRNGVLNMLSFEHGPVKAVMNKRIAVISPENDVSDAVALMKIRKASGLPVVDEDADLVGMVTKRDIINAMV